MNLSDMETLLRSMIGGPSTTDVPNTWLDARLNEAHKEIAIKFKFHNGRNLVTFSTVAAQAKYNNPGDCYAMFSIRDNTNGKPLTRIGYSKYAHRDDSLVSPQPNGKPEKWIRYRNFFIMIPTPDDIYVNEMFYATAPPDMVNPTDTPIVPEPWHIGICRLARVYHWDLKGDTGKYTSTLLSYTNWVGTMPSEIEEEAEFLDQGVEIPTLSHGVDKRLDWDHRD